MYVTRNEHIPAFIMKNYIIENYKLSKDSLAW